MVLASTLVALLSAAPVYAAPEFATVAVSAEVGRFASEHLAQQLTERGLRVVTARDMASLLGQERQRQLSGCDTTGCLAELGDALGAEALVLGELARLGKLMQVNVKVVSTRGGAARATFSRRIHDDEELLAALDEAAGVLASQLAPPGSPAAVPPGSSSQWRPLPIVLGVVAALCVAGGVVGLMDAHGVENTLRAPLRPGLSPLAIAEVDALVSRGGRSQTLGWVGLGLGAGSGAGAVVLGLSPSSPPPASGASSAPTPGSTFTLSGTF